MDGEPGPDQPASGVASAIPASLVLAQDRAVERSTLVYDWLVVGRECACVDERHRLLIDDPAVSRNYLELRLDCGSLPFGPQARSGRLQNGRPAR